MHKNFCSATMKSSVESKKPSAAALPGQSGRHYAGDTVMSFFDLEKKVESASKSNLDAVQQLSSKLFRGCRRACQAAVQDHTSRDRRQFRKFAQDNIGA
ncbi:hypothetical protein ACFS3C_11825 [Azotobacter vinelandii]